MLYAALYLGLFFLPGYLIVILGGFRAGRALFSFAFSYVFLTLNLLLLQTLRLPPSVYLPLTALGVVLLLSLVWFKIRQNQTPLRLFKFNGILFTPWLVLFTLTILYLFWVGPYAELPADIWNHLTRAAIQAKALRNNQFMPERILDLWLRQGSVWYFLYALLSHYTGISVFEAVERLSILNSLVWVTGLYLFVLKIFTRLRLKRRIKAWMAALAAFFYAVSLGVSVFSYLRYYALAPGILAFIVYLGGIFCALDLIEQSSLNVKRFIVWILFLFVLNIIHSQESLFLFFMTLGASLVSLERLRRVKIKSVPRVLTFPPVFFSVLLTTAWFGLFLFSRGRPVSPLWSTAAIPLRTFLPFARGCLIQSPVSHFYPVIGAWGVWVYLLFCWRRKELARLPFILAGMIMPLLTVFNPVTVDIFLRYLDDPRSIYRFAYMLPLPLIAAYGALLPLPPCPTKLKLPWWCRHILKLVVWLGLLVLLLPLNSSCFSMRYSRLPVLRQVKPENDWRYWQDLIVFLANRPPSAIITDTVTAYMLRGATAHFAPGDKFFFAKYDWWLNTADPDYDFSLLGRSLDPSQNWLLVLNLREGGESPVGEFSGHWPKDVLKLKQYYAPAAIAWIEAHPECLHLIWEADEIRIYEVHPDFMFKSEKSH